MVSTLHERTFHRKKKFKFCTVTCLTDGTAHFRLVAWSYDETKSTRMMGHLEHHIEIRFQYKQY